MFITSIFAYFFGMCCIYVYSHRIVSKKYLFLIIFISFLYIVSSAFYLLSDYITGNGINEAVWYHISSGIDVEILFQYKYVIALTVILFLASLYFLNIYYKKIKNRVNKRSLKTLASEVLLLISFLIHPTLFSIYDYSKDYDALEELNFSDYYLKPTIKPTREDHPNFVYIYIESLERTFLDQNIFPGLLKNIKQLELDNISFSNIQENFGTGWTTAGIVSSQCGIPLIGSDKGYDSFYKNATCLSDLLHSQGYFLSTMQGL
jgi:phosphoglycerol transferase